MRGDPVGVVRSVRPPRARPCRPASPTGIALQIAMLLGIVALLRVDWASRLARRRHARDA